MLFTIVLALYQTQQTNSDDKPHLGRGLYLPGTPVYQISDQGKTIFKDLKEKCFTKQTSTKNTARMVNFQNPEMFYQYVGEDLGLRSNQIMPRNLYKTLLQVSESISTDLKVVGKVTPSKQLFE